jgi:hypothetical protein
MVEAPHQSAEVAEQADASVSKTDVRKDVRVRLPISAPNFPSWPAVVAAVSLEQLTRIRGACERIVVAIDPTKGALISPDL